MTAPLTAPEVRARLEHPVIDADGHAIEFRPLLNDYLVAEGAGDADRLMASHLYAWDRLDWQQRAAQRAVRSPWWGLPAQNTLDLATATMPALLHERLPQIGIDVSVVYPTFGIGFAHVPHDDLRRGACRAVNRYHADVFRDYRDRLVPVAVIPMHTPDEAVAELRHAVTELGFRAVVLAGWVRRPIEASGDPFAVWYDFFGLDSPHDYDPVWHECEQLGVMPAFHSGALGWDGHQSISSYSYNHIGHFAAGNHALSRSLFLGGVTRRFPALRFAFLEGGVAWAVSLLADLEGHWHKRNPRAVTKYDPSRIDRTAYAALFQRYGQRFGRSLPSDLASTFGMTRPADEKSIDEFDGIDSIAELRDRFVPRFFFGCEADDPMTAVAFNQGRVLFGAPLRAMFSSDIGHWDVPDMQQVVVDAYDGVLAGRLTSDDFRDLCFGNPVRFYGGARFFSGTVVEPYLLARGADAA